MSQTVTSDLVLVATSLGGSISNIPPCIQLNVSGFEATIGALDVGTNLDAPSDPAELWDLLATRRAERKLPSRKELREFAQAHQAPQSWYDEDFDGF